MQTQLEHVLCGLLNPVEQDRSIDRTQARAI